MKFSDLDDVGGAEEELKSVVAAWCESRDD